MTIAKRRPIAVDLFAGAGGLSLGLEQAGFDVAAAVEYDPVHAATHEFNFPNTKVLCTDVSSLADHDELLEAVREGLLAHGHTPDSWDGQIDLVAGGPPCQGFSLIGKRLVDDSRNQLVFHFFRLVSAIRPRYFIMENVPGMAKGGHESLLNELISEFEEIGYRFPDQQRYKILNAADYGVPQERHRLFLIGSREDQRVAKGPVPSVNPLPKRPTEQRAANKAGLPSGPSVLDAIGDLPNINRYPSLLESDEVELSLEAVDVMEADASNYVRRICGLDQDREDLSYPRMWNPAVLTGSVRTEHNAESIRRFRLTRRGETEPISRFYKLDPDGLCNTLRAGSGSERGAFTSPRPLHPHRPRVLSNREAARLHSFPDWFRVHATKWHGFRQIGNSVAPLVGRAVGSQIAKALSVRPAKPSDPVPLGDRILLEYAMSEAADHFAVDRANIPAPRKRGAVDGGGSEAGRTLSLRARELAAAA